MTMIEWFKNLDTWKKIVFSLAAVMVLAGIIVLIAIFIPKYTGPEENCVFLNEKANLHNEYYITVTDFSDRNTISILKNANDLEETELIGTDKHYISVTVLIEHINVANSKELHDLDIDDFKLKDHTGVQLKNINFFSKENGLALENKNFSTIKSQTDYKWVNTQIMPGEQKSITLYFEASKNISTNDTTIVLETDFFSGRSNGKSGTDIVLAKRAA